MTIPYEGVNPNKFQTMADFSGLINGIGRFAQNRRQSQQIEQQKAEQQQQQENQQARLNEAANVFRSGNADLMSEYMIKNPDMRETIMSSQKFVNENTKAKRLESLQRVAMGEPVAAVAAETSQFIKDNGGTTEQTDAFGQLPQEQAQKAALAELAIMMEPQQFKNFANSLGVGNKALIAEDSRTAGMKDFDYYQMLKAQNPEAAKAFGAERGLLTKEGRELSSHMQKRLSTATDTAIESEANASRFEILASDIESADIGGGLLGGTWKEALKEVSGTQDAVSELRRKYAGIRASQVVNNLPPGAASDKDIELAIGGFPSDKANGAHISSFLRGMAKLEGIKADYENFKADYISENGSERGMLQEWKNKDPKNQENKQDQYPEGTLIRNPSTGQQMIMKGGQWVTQ